MNDEQTRSAMEERGGLPDPRKPYAAPTLTLFGHVAALTQGSSCSATNDGFTCPQSGGSGMGMAAPSDRRLKQDIVRVGDHPAGFGLYLFSYLPSHRDRWGHGRHFGVMADEVEQIVPEAVTVSADGFKAVYYDKLGIQSLSH